MLPRITSISYFLGVSMDYHTYITHFVHFL